MQVFKKITDSFNAVNGFFHALAGNFRGNVALARKEKMTHRKISWENQARDIARFDTDKWPGKVAGLLKKTEKYPGLRGPVIGAVCNLLLPGLLPDDGGLPCFSPAKEEKIVEIIAQLTVAAAGESPAVQQQVISIGKELFGNEAGKDIRFALQEAKERARDIRPLGATGLAVKSPVRPV